MTYKLDYRRGGVLLTQIVGIKELTWASKLNVKSP